MNTSTGTTGIGLLFEHIERVVPLSAEDRQLIADVVTVQHLKRRQFLLREGTVCRHSAFVVEGCLKGFTTDKNGFEHIMNFAPPGWWMADLYSLFSRRPGHWNIQASSPATVLLLSKNQQEMLYDTVPALERYFRILTENSLVAYQQRVMDGLSLTAEERYLHFQQKYPDLVHGLPQKEIASYIGVTPEFFSKMRHRLLKK